MCWGAGHAAAHVGDAQASLPAFDRLITNHDDLGIDEGNRIAFTPAIRVQHCHEYAPVPRCTCGAARPTPEYSNIVSIMLSINC